MIESLNKEKKRGQSSVFTKIKCWMWSNFIYQNIFKDPNAFKEQISSSVAPLNMFTSYCPEL